MADPGSEFPDRVKTPADFPVVDERYGAYPSGTRALARTIASLCLPRLEGRVRCPTRMEFDNEREIPAGFNVFAFPVHFLKDSGRSNEWNYCRIL